jgi:hypothetical protein
MPASIALHRMRSAAAETTLAAGRASTCQQAICLVPITPATLHVRAAVCCVLCATGRCLFFCLWLVKEGAAWSALPAG